MRVAEVWAESQAVIDFRGELDLIVEDLDNPAAIPGLLTMTRMSSSEFYSYPTRLYNAFPHLNITLTERDRKFVRNSTNIQKSISYLTWWIRSRLPGFPVLPVPQLARNSFHAKHDPDMPWTSDGLSAGIQLRWPPRIATHSSEWRPGLQPASYAMPSRNCRPGSSSKNSPISLTMLRAVS